MPKDPGTSAVILKEIPRWQSRGIVSAAQAKKIREMYGAGKVKQGEAGSRLVPFMAIFGAIMIGAGIILFFAMNWATIPRWVKVGAILAAMIASYHIGYVMRFSRGTFPRVGESLIFLGTIIFGAGIWLIAQIFNISSHWPLGFLYWAAGAAVVAYAVRSVSSLYVAVIALCAYVASESQYWFSLIPSSYHLAYSFFLIFLSVGIALYSLGTVHERKERLAGLRYPYHLLGAILILGALFMMSFKMFGYDENSTGALAAQQRDLLLSSHFWIIFLAVSVIAAIALVLSYASRDRKSTVDFYESFYPAVLLVFAPLSVVFATVNFWLIPVIFNIILFLAIFASISLGMLKKEQTLVNLGMLAFGIAVVARYFEYLWDVLNGYLFFIIGGILLIALAIFVERKRKAIVGRFAGTAASRRKA
ncbi:TPA: DUF2157 domain-containing protein [Candidatus Woesearchaeota archaeon]|nr:DUF2157 domain-containing protein [Candidatus Woesearchaeota archaeon]